MNSQEYLNKMKEIQEDILKLLENDEDDGDDIFHNLINLFDNLKIHENQYWFKSLLRLIANISSNHHHDCNFFNQIFKILQYNKARIKQYFSNWEIFDIFKENKRVLLFLIEEQIMYMDEYIVIQIVTKKKFLDANYPEYFAPEIRPFINKSLLYKCKRKYYYYGDELAKKIAKELPENFIELRKKSDSGNKIIEMIRKDAVEEFISYINSTNCSLVSYIETSIYESDLYLFNRKKFKLIEYAAFYGSIQIFQYLLFEKVPLNESLLTFLIHSRNADLIHLFEQNNFFKMTNEICKKCFFESVKFHHNKIAEYFLFNYLKIEEENSIDTFIKSLKYFNFAFIQNNFANDFLFNKFCQYDYIVLVDILLKQGKIDINHKII